MKSSSNFTEPGPNDEANFPSLATTDGNGKNDEVVKKEKEELVDAETRKLFRQEFERYFGVAGKAMVKGHTVSGWLSVPPSITKSHPNWSRKD